MKAIHEVLAEVRNIINLIKWCSRCSNRLQTKKYKSY